MPRKLPFSAKRKKQQLRDRRERKRGVDRDPRDGARDPRPGIRTPGKGPGTPGKRPRPPGRGSGPPGWGLGPPGRGPGPPGWDPREVDWDPREGARSPEPVPVAQMARPGRPQAPAAAAGAASGAAMAPPETPPQSPPGATTPAGLDFPRRPPWSFGMSPEELRAREEAAFGDFLRGLGDPGDTPGDSRGLAPFEHNLETWRQLWRVLEMSDIVLVIADARHPALGVPPALAAHVTQDLGKGLILILNKVDLAPPAVAVAWSHLLRARYSPARVVPFCTAPGPPPGPGTTQGGLGGALGGVWGDIGGVWGDTGGTWGHWEPPAEGSLQPRPGGPTWRQLWRVLEMSDIVLVIADARHPALGVPPALATHVTQDLGKGLILILNKVDLAPPAVAVAWSHLLRARYSPARVVPFCTAPGPPPGPVDLSSWRARLERAEQRPEDEEEEEEEEEEPPRGDEEEEEEGAGPGGVAPPRQWERYRHGVLTLGCVGERAGPGGGATVGVVTGVWSLWVLAGVYPISQLQDPYSAVGFLGSRLALPPLLQLRPPSGPGWTAWELCEGATCQDLPGPDGACWDLPGT
ncbi:guanine nucleotide-binding protein-like 1 [Onychostruthus taczanowskii]|uniref:guanine nucleotide-binding protein-like 1 n=1 Tax=Onychostruthus taczanowskii TaxID=356909 RepID=UPI001B804A21|nr:guanine nucleotide-binding protein-like 1 [Onychostruthus taczanowskii]